MAEEIVQAPIETPDPFKGGETSYEEYEKYRQDGTVPERFKEPTEAPAATEVAKPEDGKEPPQETEQDKQDRERDEKGKFTAKKDEPLFTADQQKAFDKAFAKREAKLRREFEQRYASQTSVPTPTAGETKPETAANAEPQRPEPPKLSTYKGTVEEYEKELSEYPAKLDAFLVAKRSSEERMAARSKRILESETKAVKDHPDYIEEFRKLTADIQSNEEPKLPPHVLYAIQEETDDPHGITYYLAKNREEFRRLAELGPKEALREVLKIDVKLSIAPKEEAPAPTKAEPKPKPRPPDPVGARAAATAFDVNDDKTDADEWLRQRNKQLAERRAR